MKLVACRCPECGQPLRPENEHIIVACENCGAAVHLSDDGLVPIQVGYAAPQPEAQVTEWRPFWIFRGQVHLLRRETQDGRSGELASAQFWGQPRYLYVPAWDLPLKQVREMGSFMVRHQPAYQLIPRPGEGRLLPIVLSTEDALKVAEFIVLDIEARRKDWLKRIDFRLELKDPVLCALPANEKGIVALEKEPTDE